MRQAPPIATLPRYPVTGGTIVLAIVVTIAWWSGRSIDPLTADIEIRRGELWRLLTSAFPHVDIMHLVFNVYWVWVFGTLIEETFGHLKTLLIFMLLTAGSSGAEFAFLSGGVGLSGLGYGLVGLIWMLSQRDRRFEDEIDLLTVQVFVAWFFLCIVLTYLGWPTANIAHGAGAVFGILLGWMICSPLPTRAVAAALTAIIFIGVIVGDTVARPWINWSADRGAGEAQLGYEALTAGRKAEAKRWLTEATWLNRLQADAWFNLGIANDRLDRHADALTAYRRAASLEPQNAEYRDASAD